MREDVTASLWIGSFALVVAIGVLAFGIFTLFYRPQTMPYPPQDPAPIETQVQVKGVSTEKTSPLHPLALSANASRIEAGLPPLAETSSLDARATQRAEALCAAGQWSHDGWYSSFDGLAWRDIGENLSEGFADLAAAHMALMYSPYHRANILDPEYDFIGVGEALECNLQVELFMAV